MTDWAVNILHKALLLLMGGLYWLGGELYKLFLHLSTMQVFSDSFYSNFAQRIYAVLGVFMLFYLSYALLQALVDPDKFTGKEGAKKIAMNLVTSLVLLGLLPTAFTYAYRLQNYIIGSNTIGAIILGTSVIDPEKGNGESLLKSDAGETMLQYGDAMSFLILNTFVNPENCNVNLANAYSWYDLKRDIIENGDFSYLPALGDAVSKGTDIISSDSTTCTKSGSEPLTFMPLPGIAAGCLFVYFMITFVIDLGVRVFKMAYYQLIAPIPVIMRIIPSKKDVFNNWVKGVLQTYLEVFIRIGTMYGIVYFVSALAGELGVIKDLIQQGVLGMLALVVLLFGLLKLGKEIPKMISETLGFKNGGVDLGLKNKGPLGAMLAGAGGFALGSLKKNTVDRVYGLGTGLAGAVGGAATGALGAAWDAKVNGASVLDGIKYGATMGAQKGAKAKNLKGLSNALQFSNMRQQHYSTLGLKGTAGVWGGRNWMESKNEDVKNKIQNNYNKNISEWIEAYEARDEFQNAVGMKKAERLNAIGFLNGYSQLQDANGNRVPLKDLPQYEEEVTKQFHKFESEYAKARENQRSVFAQNHQEYGDIYNRYLNAIAANNTEDQEKYSAELFKYENDNKMFDLNNTTYNSELTSDYNDALTRYDTAKKQTEIYAKELEQVASSSKLAAKSDKDLLNDVRQDFKRNDPEYKNRYSSKIKEDNEKLDREYFESDEGRRQKKMYADLAKDINKNINK